MGHRSIEFKVPVNFKALVSFKAPVSCSQEGPRVKPSQKTKRQPGHRENSDRKTMEFFLLNPALP